MAKYIGNIPSVGEFKKLDSLTSTFNGSLTQFDLEYGSTSVSVGDASQLIVSLNGIIHEPLTAYTLAVVAQPSYSPVLLLLQILVILYY